MSGKGTHLFTRDDGENQTLTVGKSATDEWLTDETPTDAQSDALTNDGDGFACHPNPGKARAHW